MGDAGTQESLAAMLEWLANGENGWLAWERIGQNADEAEGYQIAYDTLEFRQANGFIRCGVCGRSAPGEQPGRPCLRLDCDGRLVPWEGPLEDKNLNALLIAAEYSPALRPAEHSAAVGDERRQDI